jgi:hypothetical protein
MDRMIIKRNSDETIFAISPIDPENRVVLNDAAGASCSFKVYDPSIDESISVLEASGQTILSVTNTGLFVTGYDVEVTLDDGTIHPPSNVNAVDTVAGTITIADSITDSAAKGNRVRAILGVLVTMDEFGTANIDKRDWGYKGTLLNNQAAHLDVRSRDELDIDVEVIMNGGVGLISTDVLCYTIKGSLCD